MSEFLCKRRPVDWIAAVGRFAFQFEERFPASDRSDPSFALEMVAFGLKAHNLEVGGSNPPPATI